MINIDNCKFKIGDMVYPKEIECWERVSHSPSRRWGGISDVFISNKKYIECGVEIVDIEKAFGGGYRLYFKLPIIGRKCFPDDCFYKLPACDIECYRSKQ